MVIKSKKIDIQVPLLNNHKIRYQIFSCSSRRLVFKYNRAGELIIRKPSLMNNQDLLKYIEKHLKWILEHFEESQPKIRQFIDGEEYLYLGKKYYLFIQQNNHPGVYLNDQMMIVYVRNDNDVNETINKWRYQEADKIFSEVLYQAFKKMELYISTYPQLKIKKYLSRWGCCYPKRNTISLNVSLIHTPINLIEYVVFHELAHFVHLDHSPAFHRFLQQFIPDELNRRKQLKKYLCNY